MRASGGQWGWRAWAVAMPALTSGAVVGLVCLAGLLIRIPRPYPVSPWDSSMMMEVYRLLHGLPIYTRMEEDHATVIHGPLQFVWLALPTLVAGPHFWVLRMVSFLSALGVAVLGVQVFGRGLPIIVRAVCAGLVLGLSFPLYDHFVDPRPDAVAFLLSFVALLLMARGFEAGRRRAWVAGIILLIVAVFTKQTSAMFAAAPAATLFLRFRRPSLRDALMAATPLVAVGASLLIARLLFPLMSYYMFTLAGSYGLRKDLIWPMALDLLAMTPLGIIGLIALCVRSPISQPLDTSTRWLLAVLAIAVPCAVITAAQNAGEKHRLIAAMLPAMLLAIRALSLHAGFWTETGGARTRQLAASAVIAVLIPATYFRDFQTSWYWCASIYFGDNHYPRVVEAAKKLEGRVLSPNDPTILVKAKGQVGRCLTMEWDARHWQLPLAPFLDAYLLTGDWIILVESTWRDGVNREKLASLGYARVPNWEAQSPVYSLWRKGSSPIAAPGESAISLNNRAVTLMSQSKFAEAQSLLQQSLQLDPRNHLAYTNLAIIKAAQGDTAGAAAAHNLAVEIAPQESSPYYWRGRFYAAQNQLGRAISDFQAATERHNAGLGETAALIECLNRAGLTADADPLIAKAISAGNGDALEKERAGFRQTVPPIARPQAAPPSGSTTPAR